MVEALLVDTVRQEESEAECLGAVFGSRCWWREGRRAAPGWRLCWPVLRSPWRSWSCLAPGLYGTAGSLVSLSLLGPLCRWYCWVPDVVGTAGLLV